MRFAIIAGFILLETLNGFSQQRHGFVPITDGQLYYEVTGTGPPIIFLHGVCLDHRMWEQQVTYFSKTYTCITVDLRGFGQSSVPTTSPYSFHEDINTLLDSLKITDPVVLIALSMGGRAAVNFALTYPAKTKALVLTDVVVDGYTFQEFSLLPFVAEAKQNGIQAGNQLFLDDPIYSTARNDSMVFSQLRNMIMSYSGWQWTHKNPLQGLTPPALEQLEKINMPVLIITGEKDIHDFQQVAEILHTHIKQSIKKQIPGAGHMCNMEKPDIYNKLVEEFLRSGK